MDPALSNIDAERSVLGAVLSATHREYDCFPIVAEVLTAAAFADERHKLLFSAMGAVHTRGLAINRTTLAEELLRQDAIKKVTLGYIIDLEGSPTLSNLDSYCKLLAEKERLRKIDLAADTAKQRVRATDHSDAIIEALHKELNSVEDSALFSDEEVDAETIVAAKGGLDAFLSPENMRGIMTPFPRFNKGTMGLRKGEMTSFGAKPGVGKTSIACQIAMTAAENGHLVRFESHDMLPEALYFRMVCMRAEVDSMDVRAGRLGPEERRRLAQAHSDMCDIRNYLRFSKSASKTVPKMSGYMRKAASRGEPYELLIVDYLQKMRGVGKFERRDLEVAQIATGLKELTTAKGMECAVFALAQLSVDAKEQFNHAPTVDDFRESKAIGHESDNAIIGRLADVEQQYERIRNVNFYFVKARNGRTGKVPFTFETTYTLYREVPDERDTLAA